MAKKGGSGPISDFVKVLSLVVVLSAAGVLYFWPVSRNLEETSMDSTDNRNDAPSKPQLAIFDGQVFPEKELLETFLPAVAGEVVAREFSKVYRVPEIHGSSWSALDIAEGNLPVLIKNDDRVTRWPAIHLEARKMKPWEKEKYAVASSFWTPELFQRDKRSVAHVYWSSHRAFTFRMANVPTLKEQLESSSPLSRMLIPQLKPSPKSHEYRVRPLLVKKFWEKMADQGKSSNGSGKQVKDYIYVSVLVDELRGNRYMSHLNDTSMFKVPWKDDFSLSNKLDSEQTIYVWMWTKGVEAVTHLDQTLNFFVQIHGRKRFYLYPPEYHTKLNLLPQIHASSRQSTYDLSENMEEFVEKEGKMVGYIVDLKPGDVLYVPPYWFHRVVALDDSISVSVWSNSREGHVFALLKEVPVPFEENWPQSVLEAATIKYMGAVLERYFGERRNKSMADVAKEQLLNNRWLPLFKNNSFSPIEEPEGVCTLGCKEGDTKCKRFIDSKEMKDRIARAAQIVFPLIDR